MDLGFRPQAKGLAFRSGDSFGSHKFWSSFGGFQRAHDEGMSITQGCCGVNFKERQNVAEVSLPPKGGRGVAKDKSLEVRSVLIHSASNPKPVVECCADHEVPVCRCALEGQALRRSGRWLWLAVKCLHLAKPKGPSSMRQSSQPEGIKRL